MVRIHWVLAAAAGAIFVGGCSQETPGGDEGDAGDTGTEQAAAAPEYDLDTLLASADADKGRRLFLQCRACHSVADGDEHKIGPNLWNLFDSQAGLKPGFAYSEALVDSGIVWTPDQLDQWMARPSQFVPGNQMVFVGIRKPQDRADLIAYLLDVTTPAAE